MMTGRKPHLGALCFILAAAAIVPTVRGQAPYNQQQYNQQQYNQQQYNQRQTNQQQNNQQQNNRQQYGVQRVADNRAAAPLGPVRPSWIPLTPEHEKYIDQLLTYWEFKSSKIERYRSRFKRWQFDPVWGPRDNYYIYSEGRIEYLAPDKGLFKTDTMLYYKQPAVAGGKPTYEARPDDPGEQWICDGESIYQFDHKQQKLFQRELPPDMKGKAITDGPLPFLFGAQKDKIKARYWLQVVTPPGTTSEYWLEAVPKTPLDAANFKKVEVIIAQEDYLPKAIQVYPVNYDARTNPARTIFQFEKREINFRDLNDLNIFHRQFFNPATPAGWEKVVEPYRPTMPPMPDRNRAIDQSRRGLAPSFR